MPDIFDENFPEEFIKAIKKNNIEKVRESLRSKQKFSDSNFPNLTGYCKRALLLSIKREHFSITALILNTLGEHIPPNIKRNILKTAFKEENEEITSLETTDPEWRLFQYTHLRDSAKVDALLIEEGRNLGIFAKGFALIAAANNGDVKTFEAILKHSPNLNNETIQAALLAIPADARKEVLALESDNPAWQLSVSIMNRDLARVTQILEQNRNKIDDYDITSALTFALYFENSDRAPDIANVLIEARTSIFTGSNDYFHGTGSDFRKAVVQAIPNSNSIAGLQEWLAQEHPAVPETVQEYCRLNRAELVHPDLVETSHLLLAMRIAVLQEFDRFLVEEVEANDPDAVQDAIDAGANINASDKIYQAVTRNKDTLLALALRNAKKREGMSEDETPRSDKAFAIARKLLAAGADIHGRHDFDHERVAFWDATLLHHAAFFGDEETVDFLINAGEDINVRDGEGSERTALHYVAANGNLRMLEWLVTRGADIDAKDSAGETPLHEAASRGMSYSERYTSTASDAPDEPSRPAHELVDVEVNECVSACFYALIRKHGADTNATNHAGETPLHNAFSNYNLGFVETLAAANADFQKTVVETIVQPILDADLTLEEKLVALDKKKKDITAEDIQHVAHFFTKKQHIEDLGNDIIKSTIGSAIGSQQQKLLQQRPLEQSLATFLNAFLKATDEQIAIITKDLHSPQSLLFPWLSAMIDYHNLAHDHKHEGLYPLSADLTYKINVLLDITQLSEKNPPKDQFEDLTEDERQFVTAMITSAIGGDQETALARFSGMVTDMVRANWLVAGIDIEHLSRDFYSLAQTGVPIAEEIPDVQASKESCPEDKASASDNVDEQHHMNNTAQWAAKVIDAAIPAMPDIDSNQIAVYKSRGETPLLNDRFFKTAYSAQEKMTLVEALAKQMATIDFDTLNELEQHRFVGSLTTRIAHLAVHDQLVREKTIVKFREKNFQGAVRAVSLSIPSDEQLKAAVDASYELATREGKQQRTAFAEQQQTQQQQKSSFVGRVVETALKNTTERKEAFAEKLRENLNFAMIGHEDHLASCKPVARKYVAAVAGEQIRTTMLLGEQPTTSTSRIQEVLSQTFKDNVRSGR